MFIVEAILSHFPVEFFNFQSHSIGSNLLIILNFLLCVSILINFKSCYLKSNLFHF